MTEIEFAPDLPALASHDLERAPVRDLDGETFVFEQPSSPPALWGSGGEVIQSPGESLEIIGPEGVGKSTLAQQLILGRLGIISRLLDMPVQPTSGTVLYLAMDRPAQAARSMRRMVDRAEHGEILRERLQVWRGPLPINPLGATSALADWIADRYADVTDVFVDSLKDVIPKLSDEVQASQWNSCRQELLARGIQVVELHHQRKQQQGAGKPNTLADVYGSRWITAGAGSVLMLWGDAGDTVVELTHIKQPADPFGPHKLIHDHAAGRTSLFEPADLLETLRRYTQGLTVHDAAAYIFANEAPSRNEIERARRKLNKLVDADLATRSDEGSTATRYFPAVNPA